MEHLQPLSYLNVDITGGFWAAAQKRNRDVTIPAVRDRFEETGRFKAFDFTWKEGADEPEPHFFWDSDVAKWIESAAYELAKAPDDALQALVERVIDRIEAHMEPDGYFNIWHTVVQPGSRFQNQDRHELYCLGHLLEAAVAYYEATGRDRFLNTMDRYVELVYRTFVEEKSAAFDVPGHEEIELALYRAWRARPRELYKELANYFIDKRGTDPKALGGWCHPLYCQNHIPVRSQREAVGHCVRACYLYSGMADYAAVNGDEEMLAACRDLFEDVTRRKMYVTGGIGSTHRGEAFTIPYDLPNASAYTETCASIALAMFANRMLVIDPDSRYADVTETEIYNGILSGLSLDGEAFFYENPLEIDLQMRKRDVSTTDAPRWPITQRQKCFWCSCCPPNLTRFIASLSGCAISVGEKDVYLHQFMPLRAETDGLTLTVETNYPVDGDVRVRVLGGAGKRLKVRLPGWCRHYTADRAHTVDRGYLTFDVPGDDCAFEIGFDLTPCFITADPRVAEDVGKVAVRRGPVVYCAEAVDTDASLALVRADTAETPRVIPDDGTYGVPTLVMKACVIAPDDDAPLYSADPAVRTTPAELPLIPYFAFANRGETDMRVWLTKA